MKCHVKATPNPGRLVAIVWHRKAREQCQVTGLVLKQASHLRSCNAPKQHCLVLAQVPRPWPQPRPITLWHPQVKATDGRGSSTVLSQPQTLQANGVCGAKK